jgi:AAHS family 4-hydroxybenzoate transporter-like MFS transporter
MAAIPRPLVDVTQLIDRSALSSLQGLVIGVCAFTMFTNGYDLQVMALTVPSLAKEWALSPSRFGYGLTAANVGIVVAATFLAPWGDRVGRRPLLIAALVLGGVATALTASATSPDQFVLWRFLTGLGVGMNIPNANAWTSEYAPARARATYLILMNASIAAGSIMAGVIAPVILDSFGWRGTFVIGGVAPLLTAVVIFFAAPESLKFLMARRPNDARVPAILERIAPDLDPATIRRPVAGSHPPNPSVWVLLGSRFRFRTLVLWTIMPLNLFTFYVLISWLPTLLQSAGWSIESAVRGSILIPTGGVIGGLALSFFLNRGMTRPTMVAAYLTSAVCLLLFKVIPSGPAWVAMLFIIGGGVSGSQLALNALSTAYYPPAIKATGMSWVGVLGNLGSILAPLLGGWLIARGTAPIDILASLGVPALACAAIALSMRNEWQSDTA